MSQKSSPLQLSRFCLIGADAGHCKRVYATLDSMEHSEWQSKGNSPLSWRRMWSDFSRLMGADEERTLAAASSAAQRS